MIFYECFADRTLLECLGVKSGSLKGGHSTGRSRVSAKLQKLGGSLGLIDEDPGASMDSYLRSISVRPPLYDDKFFSCIDDHKLNNRILILKPNLEALLIKVASDLKIDLRKQYGLPDKEQYLHDVLRIEANHFERSKLSRFVMDNMNHPSFRKLIEFLNK
jgi:hypothetical protein